MVDSKMQGTATVEWERRKRVGKFERYLTQKTRVKAHNPAEVNAKRGDIVRIKECRPLSKTKHFVILDKVGHERLFEAKKALLEEGKKPSKAKSSNDAKELEAEDEGS